MSCVLIVEDNLGMREMLEQVLREAGYSVTSVADGKEALAKLDDEEFDLLITDYRMPRATGMEVLAKAHEKCPDTVVVMITAHGSIEHAVKAVRSGAFDYVTKPFSIEELEAKISKAMTQRNVLLEKRYLRDTIRDQYGKIIGSSSTMKELKALISKVAQSQTPVLIFGESGTGKELVAREIHDQSPLREGPFVPINCAALPDTLLESELFGYEKGAFTGAANRKKGRVEIAEGGTLFLDEVGEIALPIQVKLLRFLQDKYFERVGGVERIKVDCRIITATNQPLKERIKEGSFREDLYYRIHVLSMQLPSLREHCEDIPELVDFFVGRLNKQMHKNVSIHSEAMELLKNYAWPGNVRELENVLERTIVLAESDLILAQNLPSEIRLSGEKSDASNIEAFYQHSTLASLTDKIESLERNIILKTLERNRWNQTISAKQLGLKRSSLQYKMTKYGLDKSSNKE